MAENDKEHKAKVIARSAQNYQKIDLKAQYYANTVKYMLQNALF